MVESHTGMVLNTLYIISIRNVQILVFKWPKHFPISIWFKTFLTQVQRPVTWVLVLWRGHNQFGTV